MKHIANVFTLLNLVFGCLAIIAALQSGLTTTVDENNITTFIILPEKIYLASVFIGCAAVIDFLDGFIARLLKATSEMGKQLDSLADIVSFGVAPSMIAYQFLQLSFAKNVDALDVNQLWMLPAFLIPMAGATRLARFNLDTSSSTYFKGVPIPAAGLTIASFPLIYWFSENAAIINIITHTFFWYGLILIISLLMISRWPMLSLKFKHFSIQKNWPIVVLAIGSIIGAFTIGWLTVPFVFALYVLLSIFTIKNEKIG